MGSVAASDRRENQAAASEGPRGLGTGSGTVTQLVRALRAMIVAEGLSTGDSLPTERDLAERFGVSRNTMREAIGALRAYGVVEVRPKVGAVLINRHIEAALDVFSFQLAISAETFRDVQAFRNLVEVGIFDLVQARVTEADYAQLTALTDVMGSAATDEESAEADLEFHTRLVALSGNKTLADVFRILEPMILRLMANGKSSHGRELAVESHRQIISALRRGDRLAYQFYMTDHLQQGRIFFDDPGPAAGK